MAKYKATRDALRRPVQPPAEGAGAGLWLYGRHSVLAAVANPARRVERLLATREAALWLRTVAPDRPPETVAREAIDRVVPADAVHQGLAMLTRPLVQPSLEALLAARPAPGPLLIVVLDRISDPHNVGAVIRSAAAFGAAAAVATDRHFPPETGVLAKAASGALEQVPMVRAENLARAIETLKAADVWTVGLAEDAPHRLDALDLAARLAFVLGAEGSGLRRLTRERCDLLAGLPTAPAMPSLNVSNAAAIALYEAARQRWHRHGQGC